MGATPVLQVVLLVAGIALCAVTVYGIIEAVATLRSVRSLSDDMQARLVPLLDKVDVTVDAVNAELLRIDGILTQIEEVSDRVTTTTTAVQGAVNAPLEVVSNIGTTLRGAWKRSRNR